MRASVLWTPRTSLLVGDAFFATIGTWYSGKKNASSLSIVIYGLSRQRDSVTPRQKGHSQRCDSVTLRQHDHNQQCVSFTVQIIHNMKYIIYLMAAWCESEPCNAFIISFVPYWALRLSGAFSFASSTLFGPISCLHSSTIPLPNKRTFRWCHLLS